MPCNQHQRFHPLWVSDGVVQRQHRSQRQSAQMQPAGQLLTALPPSPVQSLIANLLAQGKQIRGVQQFLLLCRQAVDHLFLAVAVLSQPMQQHCMRHFMRHSMFHLNSSFDKACKKAALLCPLADEGGFISSAVPLHDLSLLPFNAGDTSLYTGAVFCAFQRAADRCIQKVAYP